MSPEPEQTPTEPQAGGSVEQPEAADAEQANLLEQLRTDLEEAKDRVLRSQAELENYRKRASREIEDNRRFANLPLLRDLLPVMDNMERAIGAAEKSQDASALLEGIKLVARQFADVLARNHCVPIPALNQPFDPHLHQAISQQATDEFPPGTVVLVSQPGYQLYDRVVRPSQVIVSTSPSTDRESED
ncbi:MAG: nucleotide exchange factor GrpE [Thermoguttaceae bacterium]|jgi:molecular chaperone GrpE